VSIGTTGCCRHGAVGGYQAAVGDDYSSCTKEAERYVWRERDLPVLVGFPASIFFEFQITRSRSLIL
jgi:hypothetical protein